jgi:hypothetical protein
MRRFGFTASGTQRWQCGTCHTIQWLIGSERLRVLKRRWKVSYETIRRHFEPLCAQPPSPLSHRLTKTSVLILDATSLVSRSLVSAGLAFSAVGVVIAQTFPDEPIAHIGHGAAFNHSGREIALTLTVLVELMVGVVAALTA